MTFQSTKHLAKDLAKRFAKDFAKPIASGRDLRLFLVISLFMFVCVSNGGDCRYAPKFDPSRGAIRRPIDLIR
jgi:hypothetical protein